MKAIIKKLKRLYWQRRFNQMDEGFKTMARYMKVDPDSLIKRGEL